MTKEWFSAAELAGLPGMPGTDRAIQIAAKKNTWRSRPRQARGGGNEYHITSLPEATRTHLLRQATAVVAALLQSEALPAPAEERRQVADLTDTQRQTMQARLYILSLIDEMAVPTSRGEAVNAFIAMARAGDLPPEAMQALDHANARKGAHRLVHRATLYRWFEERDEHGQAAVAPKAPRPRPMPAWLPLLLTIYQRPQKPSVAACLRDWADVYPGIDAPHPRTAQRHVEALPIEVREWGRMGRAARRAIQPFVRRTTDGLWPMDVVTVDGHLFKGYVRHPLTGRRMRPEVTTYLDIATRRAIGFSAWLAESQYAIWIALGDMVLNPQCGVPALHYSDNGAYRGERHRAVMARIGTTMMFSEAYRAQARGVIERFNSSVWVPLAKTMPTYCGDDADSEHFKKQLALADAGGGTNLLAWDDFVAACRKALADYNARPHSHLGRKSPDQAWAAAVADGWQPTALTDDDLHDLLPSEERTVSRGEISLPWGRYFNDDLRRWHGQKVRVSFNPVEGERVFVADDRGRLICQAVRNGNARPYVHDTQIGHAQAQREQGRVQRLERKLEAVREEGAAQITYQPTEVDPVLQAEVVAAIEAEERSAVTSITDERKLHAYWMRIEQRIDAGEQVGDEERRGFTVYRNSLQYRSMQELFEAFDMRAEDFA